MSRIHWLGLAALGILVAAAMAHFIRVPGYMDAEYYYATSTQLAGGRGLVEPFLWNYLDDPAGLPHPSHLYWMPLSSLVAAAGLVLFGPGFRSAQLPFVVLTAGLPILTAWAALRLGASSRQAFLAGLLGAFPGFYLPFQVTTDAFALFAWIGTLALAAAAAAWRGARWPLWAVAGAMAGAGYLARADGLLLLVPILGLAAFAPRQRLQAMALVLSGCAVVVVPWMARSLAVSGSVFSPGGVRTLWLTSYDALFSYPASALSSRSWASVGLASALAARARALSGNLESLLAVTGGILLGPFILIGAWRRRDPMVAACSVYLTLLLAVMTLVFPFSGSRGGFFHSSAATFPILWAIAPIGLDRALEWIVPRRGWDKERAWRLFAPLLVVGMASISVWVAWDRAAAGWPDAPRWEQSQHQLKRVAETILDLDSTPGVVAANNPPGFYLASDLPSVVIPYGDAGILLQVAARYGVGWIVLDANHPSPLADVYADPDSVDGLALEAQIPDAEGRPIYLLRVDPARGSPWP